MENQSSPPATSIGSSSSSSTDADPSSSSGGYGHYVFINHRGPDTKNTFASHLYLTLHSRGLRPFLDQQELQEGSDFPSQLEAAIRSASVHVAIFSATYAESPWCLHELLLMLQSTAPIIPVFYHVKPTEPRWGVYAEALDQLQLKKTYDSQTRQEKPRYDSGTIQKWRNALSNVANIAGFDLDGAFNGDEGQMLDRLVQRVVQIMAKKIGLYVADYPTGLDDKIEEFETTVLRQQHTKKVHMVGIVGLGGMGKTTLAKEYFNRNHSQYDKSCFLSDVRENAKSSLHSLQNKLLKDFNLLDRHTIIDDIHQGTEMLRNFLSSFHVLLVLDDIDHQDQVVALLPNKAVLSSASLILITSGDRGVLTRSGVEDLSIYKLTGLTTQHSQELFCSYAFCQAYPREGFQDSVDKFLRVCEGLPLSLKVLGALLCGKYDRSDWEDMLQQVVNVPSDIQKRLRISYDALTAEEQEIFLEIACFFIGANRDLAIRMSDGSNSKGFSGLQSLESKCLLEVDSHNVIHMHDHLRNLGRNIAKDKLPRRLWRVTGNINDWLHQQSSVISQARGIRMLSYTERHHYVYNSPMFSWYQKKIGKVFGKYRSPRIGAMDLQLMISEGHLLKPILRRVHSPNLRWLYWRACPYSYLPSWIPMKNLRFLKLEESELKTLWQDESQAPLQLCELEITKAFRFTNIPKSIGQLKHLERIVIESFSLAKLPKKIFHLNSLRVLELSTRSMKSLPYSFGTLRNLQHMVFFWNDKLERLPDSFGNLASLQHIDLSWCEVLERLPDSFGNLMNLQHMDLSWCHKLERLPDSFGNLRKLQHMKLFGCSNCQIPLPTWVTSNTWSCLGV